jgi:uncharacterized protein (UPF0333 family)
MDCNNPGDIALWARVLFLAIIVVSGPVMLYIYHSHQKFVTPCRKDAAEQADQQTRTQGAKYE